MTSANETGTATNRSSMFLILAVVAVGFAAAAASWWFRYSSTHRAVEYWGTEAVELIRDAPRVTLRTDDTADIPQDISQAPGLTHMRASLLEDRSYDWTATGAVDSNWSNSLVFEVSEGAEPRVVVLFSPDFRWAANGSRGDPADHAVSTEPIAAGLQKFFGEQVEPKESAAEGAPPADAEPAEPAAATEQAPSQ